MSGNLAHSDPLAPPLRRGLHRPMFLLWLAVLAATLLLVLFERVLKPWTSGLLGTELPSLPAWLFKYPRAWQIPLKAEISAFMKWLVNDASFGVFTFQELTRSIAS